MFTDSDDLIFNSPQLQSCKNYEQKASLLKNLKLNITVRFLLQMRKSLELYEQLRQRMGVVVVGPSGSGKTTLWKNLRLALAKTGQVVKQYVMNPKAMPRTQVRVKKLIISEASRLQCNKTTLQNGYAALQSDASVIACGKYNSIDFEETLVFEVLLFESFSSVEEHCLPFAVFLPLFDLVLHILLL